MKSHEKTIRLAVLLGLGVLAGTSAAMYWGLPGRTSAHEAATQTTAQYTCPMHPEVQSSQPGNCPECEMALVSAPKALEADPAASKASHGCCPSPASSASARSKRAECPYQSTGQTPPITTAPPPGCPMHKMAENKTSNGMTNHVSVESH